MLFNFEQTNIDLLTAPRDLVTSETHQSNDFYGQASVMKRYAGLPETRPLFAVLEHGICLHDQMWHLDRDAQLNTILSASRRRAEQHRQLCRHRVHPVGFGYIYATELVRQQFGDDPVDRERAGTIAFPCHSTHTINTIFDHEQYADRLMSLPLHCHPIYVCAYWKDFQEGALQPYVDAGCRIVTAGHMFDRDFLLRFHDICRHFRYAVSNMIGTHLFQSVHSGCRFFYVASSKIKFEVHADEAKNCAKSNPRFQQTEQQSWKLFSEFPIELTSEQRAFVDSYLGSDLMLTPHQLRAILRNAKLRFQLRRRAAKFRRSLAKRLSFRKSAA
jgi:hypothetical protein